VLVEERNFAEFSSEIAHDHVRKCHELGLRVGCHGKAALEGASAVSRADPGSEDKGVAAIEDDSCLDEDLSLRDCYEIFGEIPYLARQLSVF
jgi:hypothetical protein